MKKLYAVAVSRGLAILDQLSYGIEFVAAGDAGEAFTTLNDRYFDDFHRGYFRCHAAKEVVTSEPEPVLPESTIVDSAPNEKWEQAKRRTFLLLARKGATKAVLEFEGGGDEGGVESITLYIPLADGTSLEIKQDDWYGGFYGEKPEFANEEQELSHLLQDPIYSEYQTFAGEFHVNGTLTWDVTHRTVTMSKDESVEQYEHFEQVM